MALFKICSKCNTKYEYGLTCPNNCMDKASKQRHIDYNKQRMSIEELAKRQRFYSTNRWLMLSEYIKNKYYGMCVMCWSKGLTIDSVYTHHIEELAERWDLRLMEDNLVPLCSSCHQQIHVAYKSDKAHTQKTLKETCTRLLSEY